MNSKKNQDIADSIVQDENVIYIANNLSFSNKKHLITHGGSYLLEVMIPFIKITDDK